MTVMAPLVRSPRLHSDFDSPPSKVVLSWLSSLYSLSVSVMPPFVYSSKDMAPKKVAALKGSSALGPHKFRKRSKMAMVKRFVVTIGVLGLIGEEVELNYGMGNTN